MLQAELLLISAVVLWSSAFVGIRVALQDYSPGAIALFRFLVAAICLTVPYLRLKTRSKFGLQEIGLVLVIGPLGIAGYSILLNYGELWLTAGIASFIVSMTPVFSSLLALGVLNEQATPRLFLGLTTSVLGLCLIAWGESNGVGNGWAVLLVFMAVLFGAAQSLAQKVLLRHWSSIELVTISMWAAVLPLSYYSHDVISGIQTGSHNGLWACIYLGIAPAFIAQWCWSEGLSRMPLTHANAFLFSMPIITSLMGWLLLSETPGFLSLLGGGIALAGAWISQKT